MFDPATARDLVDALRLLDGRLRDTKRRLSPGARQLRAIAEADMTAERSGGVSTVHSLQSVVEQDDDGSMPHLLTLEDVADHLQQSVSTVKRLVKAKSLPCVRIGRSVRVRPADLQKYIEALPASSAKEVA